MGDRKAPRPAPGEPGYTGPAQVKPAPPPAPPPRRADEPFAVPLSYVGKKLIEGVEHDVFIVGDSDGTPEQKMMRRLMAYAKHDADCQCRAGFGYCSCGLESLLKDLRESGLTGST